MPTIIVVFQVTRKSLDAAGCTGEPLLVIARNRVFLCILHCCMAFGRLFMAFLEAQVGNHPLEVAGGGYKKPVWRVVWGAERTGPGGPVLGLGADGSAACMRRGGPTVASGCGALIIATHCVLAPSGCATPFVPTCYCCVSGTLLRGVGVALFVVTRRGL